MCARNNKHKSSCANGKGDRRFNRGDTSAKEGDRSGKELVKTEHGGYAKVILSRRRLKENKVGGREIYSWRWGGRGNGIPPGVKVGVLWDGAWSKRNKSKN